MAKPKAIQRCRITTAQWIRLHNIVEQRPSFNHFLLLVKRHMLKLGMKLLEVGLVDDAIQLAI
jgi:hypothetical protein